MLNDLARRVNPALSEGYFGEREALGSRALLN